MDLAVFRNSQCCLITNNVRIVISELYAVILAACLGFGWPIADIAHFTNSSTYLKSFVSCSMLVSRLLVLLLACFKREVKYAVKFCCAGTCDGHSESFVCS